MKPHGELCHRAICLSGSYSSVLLHNSRPPRHYATCLATRLGYTGDMDNNKLLLEFLQSVSSANILQAQMMFKVRPELRLRLSNINALTLGLGPRHSSTLGGRPRLSLLSTLLASLPPGGNKTGEV